MLNQNQYQDPQLYPKPSIVLLDLNLPKTDGREVLRQIKANRKLVSIPVIVLTTSADPKDIELSYIDGANSYICKPVNFDGFMKFLACKSIGLKLVFYPMSNNV